MAQKDVRYRIIAQDDTTVVLERIDKRTQKLEKSTRSLGKTYQQFNRILAATWSGYALERMAQGTIELARQGAAAAAVAKSFQTLTAQAGRSQEEVLASIQKASRGAISSFRAMAAANSLIATTGAAGADAVPQLIEIARAASRATNAMQGTGEGAQDLNQVLETLIRGINKGSARLIDNAEIYIQVEKAVRETAEATGQNVEELTLQEKQLIILNTVLEEGAEFVRKFGNAQTDTIDDIESFTTSIKDAWTGIGRTIARELGPSLALLAEWQRGANEASLQAPLLLAEIIAIAESLDRVQLTQSELASMRFFGDYTLDGLREYRDEMYRLQIESEQSTITNRQFGEQLQRTWVPMRRLEDTGKGVADSFDEQAIEAQYYAGVLKDTGDAADYVEPKLRKINELMLAFHQAMQIEQDKLYVGASDAIINYATLGERTTKAAVERVQAEGDAREEEVERQKRLAEQYARAWESAYKRAQEATRTLVEEAALLGSEVTRLDQLQTAAGTYTDKALESARRLDDIANRGTDSPWAKILVPPPEVLAAGNDAVRAWAAQMAQDTRDLLRPDLIDKDAFLAQFQQLQQDEAQREATLDMLVQWVTDEGLVDSKAAAQKAIEKQFGTPSIETQLDFKVPGQTELQTAITDELTSSNAGTAIVNAWNSALADKYSDFQELGETVAEQIWAGYSVRMAELFGPTEFSGGEPTGGGISGGLE